MAQRAKENLFLRPMRSAEIEPLDIAPPRPITFDDFDTSSFELGWVVGEYEKQATVVEAQKAKTVYAMRLVTEIHNAGYLTKRDALAYLVALDDTADFPGEIGQIWDAARREQLIMFIDHIHKLIRTGAKNIAIEVNRSLYPPPPPPPPKRRGFIARLLLGEG